jgi:hypothetical protein
MTEEYLTVEELARRLNYSPKTVRNKIALGVFKKGVHYGAAEGLPMLFKWSAVIASYDWKPEASTAEAARADGIPMAQGYTMR